MCRDRISSSLTSSVGRFASGTSRSRSSVTAPLPASRGVRVSPHTLRHTFATQYILNGGDAFSLQQILGHSTLEMVKIYVRLANRDVALQHKKYSPIDLMGPMPGASRKIVMH